AGGDDASAARISALRLCWRAVHWFSTGLLIALTAGTAAWTCYLLRRLFVVEPVAPAPTTAVADNSEEPHA
ncbi:MAG: hypothetical protein L0I76_34685, partial [Pseudonocardia sp.]|nr:hypothetical protein [Pseudonocardia sp.]